MSRLERGTSADYISVFTKSFHVTILVLSSTTKSTHFTILRVCLALSYLPGVLDANCYSLSFSCYLLLSCP